MKTVILAEAHVEADKVSGGEEEEEEEDREKQDEEQDSREHAHRVQALVVIQRKCVLRIT
eukprot:751197-Hanusia_phi.AAC.2